MCTFSPPAVDAGAETSAPSESSHNQHAPGERFFSGVGGASREALPHADFSRIIYQALLIRFHTLRILLPRTTETKTNCSKSSEEIKCTMANYIHVPDEAPAVPKIDVTVDESDYRSGALKLIKELRPNWKPSEVKIKVLY